jgi:isoleucyl-tRNA synthetase
MKAVASCIEALSQTEIQGLLEGAALSIDVEGQDDPPRTVELTADKLDIRRIEKAALRVLNEGTLTVGLDTELTAELSREGDARDLVRGVQNLRKETGLEVTDRIALSLYGSDRLKAAWEAFGDYVAAETLATSVEWGRAEGQIPIEAGEEQWQVSLRKV